MSDMRVFVLALAVGVPAVAGAQPVDPESTFNAGLNHLREGRAMASSRTMLKSRLHRVTVTQADLDYDDPGEANREFDEINRVTAQDVQRVARRYFTPEHRSVFYMLPESMRSAAGATTGGAGKEVKP